jgi:DNA adenine methylase
VTSPPFSYFGGKSTLAPRIADMLPKHRHYIEPYAGSLAVLLAKAPAPFETVNDLDGNLVNFWRVLREQPDDLARVCALTPHSRVEYATCRDTFDDPHLTDLERARRTWVALTQGRGGTLRPTGWRHFQDPRGTGSGMPAYLTAYVDRMRGAAARLGNVSLECRDALDVIADYGRHAENLIYADPPYLGSTRSSRQYLHELSHDDEHRALAETLHACEAAVVLSGYRSPLYDELYASWHVHELPAFTGQANTNGRRTEVLWSNRPLVDTLDLDFGQEATA